MSANSRERLTPEVRRAQILDEAIGFIAERGYHGFTIQELARRCGITNGALLYYFDSKERLLIAVLEERDRREGETVLSTARGAARAAKDQGDLGGALALLRAIIERSAALPELTRLHMVLQSEALDRSHPAHDYFRRREDLVLKGFSIIAKPHVKDAASGARELLAMMDGLTLRWLACDQCFDLVAAWEPAAEKLLSPNRSHPGSDARRRRIRAKTSQ